MTTIERIKNILDEYNGENNTITAETEIKRDLSINSLAFFQLLNEVEDEFGVRINDRDIILFRTIGDLAEYIEKQGK